MQRDAQRKGKGLTANRTNLTKKEKSMIKISDKIDSLEKLEAYFESTRPEGREGPALNSKAVKNLTEELGPLDAENFWVWREYVRDEKRTSGSQHTGYNKMVDLDGWEFNRLHYLHVSREDKTKVAYTENADKGRRDIQLRTTIGRYIKKMFPDTSDDNIRLASAAYTLKYVPPKILFAKTQDEIEIAYEESPLGSCMKRSHNNIKTITHPVRCYASGDFVVAYYLNPKGEMAARAVCALNEPGNPAAGGKYVRIYGDSDRMVEVLNAAGFVHAGDAYLGKRLLRILDEGTDKWIVPYLDGYYTTGSESSCGEYWDIGGHDYDFQKSSGFLGRYVGEEDDSRECGNCGNSFDEDDINYIERINQDVCNRCLDRYFTYAATSRRCMEYVSSDETDHCESTNKYYAFNDSFSPEDVGLTFDIDGALQKEDDCVRTLDEEMVLQENCQNVGENWDGGTLWVYDDYIKYHALDFWKNMETGDVLHETDTNVEEWLGGKDDEDHDPLFYKNMAEVFSEEAALGKAMQEALKTELPPPQVLPLPISKVPRPLPPGTKVSWLKAKAVVVVDYGLPSEVIRVIVNNCIVNEWECLCDGTEILVEKFPEPVVKQEEAICP